jgi:hypothetical protein
MLEPGVPGSLVGGDVVDQGGFRWRTESLQRWGGDSVRELSGTDFHHPPALRGQPLFGLGQLLTQVRARLRRFSLDAALARGVDPCESPLLAYRAARLTSERSRGKMAAWVADILATAKRPARALSAAVEPDRDEVVAAEPLLMQVRELLQSTVPVYARGVAMLEDLLGDGGSPLYLPARRAELSHELELIIAALEGREQPESSWADRAGPGD